MPRTYLCFLWHMHQPFYKDLISGQYCMPWTRLHALKDYYGMVRMLEEFPQVRVTFNLVPSMLMQVEEYAAGQADDPWLAGALRPAESLSQAELDHLLRGSFAGNPARMIYRYPRYGELYDAWRAADRNPQRARLLFGTQAVRDLQVLSQLAWFDEEYLARDAEVRELAAQGRDFTLGDQQAMARKQREILGAVLPVHREFLERGQIEISTTPFYHPILPLLCDSNIAEVAHPYVPLPSRFRYPADARLQLERARIYMADRFGAAPAGLWPSEGSVSDEALGLAAEAGFRWAATDNGVLARTLGHAAGVEETYRPHVWRHGGREMRMLFRDHALSDLIGFVYARLGAAEAARDFLGRIRENCRGILAAGRDALVPVILDGENAWEYYERNGRPFLRELYRQIDEDPRLEALTVSQAMERLEPQPLDHIFPGSWIGANFDIWIGAEEDNRAWEYLLRARRTFDEQAVQVSEENRALAQEELLIAEGSDWCWWYGPEHASDYRAEFDELFRTHLANVYRALNLRPPDELSRPILTLAAKDYHLPPSGPIRPTIDGEVTSYFEWLGAGSYRVEARSGAMHGKRFLMRELFYGSDGVHLYVRIDFQTAALEALPGAEARLSLQSAADPGLVSCFVLEFAPGGVRLASGACARPHQAPAAPSEFAFRKILEARFALAALGVKSGQAVRLQLSLWKDGLPLDALPQQGYLDISTAEPTDWPL
ncbi:MAG: glycoside hydrolase [Acidobacteria bacterium]|nr:glycoside hydrolase [Acidobacteriota bacterium]